MLGLEWCSLFETKSAEKKTSYHRENTGMVIWVKVSKNGPSKLCGKQPLKNLKWHGLPKQSNCLKTVFHKFYLVHSWIPWPIWNDKFVRWNTFLIKKHLCLLSFNKLAALFFSKTALRRRGSLLKVVFLGIAFLRKILTLTTFEWNV